MCFGDTREIRIDIEQGTPDGLVAELVAATKSGRFYGIGDSAGDSSGPNPMLQVAVPNPFPAGWRITGITGKARGSDAPWHGVVKLKTYRLGVDDTAQTVLGLQCDMTGGSGQEYDTCSDDLPDGYELAEEELLALFVKDKKTQGNLSALTRVTGCITVEPPEEEEEEVEEDA